MPDQPPMTDAERVKASVIDENAADEMRELALSGHDPYADRDECANFELERAFYGR